LIDSGTLVAKQMDAFLSFFQVKQPLPGAPPPGGAPRTSKRTNRSKVFLKIVADAKAYAKHSDEYLHPTAKSFSFLFPDKMSELQLYFV